MDKKTYLFCLEYYNNHVKGKDKCINKFIRDYNRILDLEVNDTTFLKRLYNKNYEEALRIEQENLNFCEAQVQIQENEMNCKTIEAEEIQPEKKPTTFKPSLPVIGIKGKEILEFASINKAEKFIKKKGIKNAILNNKPLAGYKWSFP